MEVLESIRTGEQSLFQEDDSNIHDPVQLDKNPEYLGDLDGAIIEIENDQGDTEDELELEIETDDSREESDEGDSDQQYIVL